MEGNEIWLVMPEDLILLKLMSFRLRDRWISARSVFYRDNWTKIT
jgi:hypothetical protein